MKIPFSNKVIIFLIVVIRPLFGSACCRYVISCTQFARFQLEEKPLISALWAIIKRLCACNPLW